VPASGAATARQSLAPPRRRDLEELSPEARRFAVEEYLTREVRSVLGLGDDQEVDPLAPLLDTGLDSLAAIELRDRLAQAASAPFPASLLFDNPSIVKLAEVMLVAILPSAAVANIAPDEAAPIGAPEDDGLEQLSSAELHSLLARELRGEAESGWR
jgi:aryl carrier-like protein